MLLGLEGGDLTNFEFICRLLFILQPKKLVIILIVFVIRQNYGSKNVNKPIGSLKLLDSVIKHKNIHNVNHHLFTKPPDNQ